MSEKSTASSGGIGVFGLLGVAFVVLKLCGVINWSWWWVTAPFWGGLAVIVAVAAVIGIVYLVALCIDSIRNARNARRRRR